MDPLLKTIASFLSLDPESLQESDGPATLPAWDSLKHVMLLSLLEERFSVSFSTDDMLALKDIGTIRKLLRDKGVTLRAP